MCRAATEPDDLLGGERQDHPPRLGDEHATCTLEYDAGRGHHVSRPIFPSRPGDVFSRAPLDGEADGVPFVNAITPKFMTGKPRPVASCRQWVGRIDTRLSRISSFAGFDVIDK